MRIFTNLTARQLADITKLSIREDRSISWLISRAVTLYIDDILPYEGSADFKVMARTTPENGEKIKQFPHGTQWRAVNAAVQKLLDEL